MTHSRQLLSHDAFATTRPHAALLITQDDLVINNKLSKVLVATTLGTLAAAGASLVEHQTARAQGSATVGSLRGQIRDKAVGEAAVGATIVATSPALQGEQVDVADEDGAYFITSLPPGVYTLTLYYNDATFSRSNVLIQVGKEAVINVTVDSGAATGKPRGEVIEIAGTAPIIDQGSTKTGITITDDYTAIEAFVDVFNLFDEQDELDQDETYTFDSAIPVVGGTPEDLMHVKAIDAGTAQETNTTVVPNKNYGNTNVRTAPRTVRLGFRLTF